MNKKPILAAVAAGAAVAAFAATVPTVSSVTMAQSTSSRLVTITYNVDAEAVITLDIQTNYTENAETKWASIGGEAIWNAAGDVWKKVASGSHTITWRPDLSWPDHKIEGEASARAVVTAWALDNPPDYMVVNLALEKTADGFLTYYPGEAYLPKSDYAQTKAITQNPEYKTNKLVMRKIMASGVTWTVGSASGEPGRGANETPHEVTLDHNYYIGVFPITFGQLDAVGARKSMVDVSETAGNSTGKTSWENWPTEYAPKFTNKEPFRPVEGLDGNMIYKTTYANVDKGSFIRILRSSTGIADWSLPFEVEWEFAARAGWGSGFWGNGTQIQADDANGALAALGRFGGNTSIDDTTVPEDGGTPVVGSHAPNDWGLYDMFGTVRQLCMDTFADTSSTTAAAPDWSATTEAGNKRVVRGGAWCDGWAACRPAARTFVQRNTAENFTGKVGFRVVCRAGLK